jgi:hypothetical protein
MELDRRQAILSVAMALVARPARAKPERIESELPECHQLTRSLIERARRASTATNRVDTDAIERVIWQTAEGFGRSPVIKWMASPAKARPATTGGFRRYTSHLWGDQEELAGLLVLIDGGDQRHVVVRVAAEEFLLCGLPNRKLGQGFPSRWTTSCPIASARPDRRRGFSSSSAPPRNRGRPAAW